MEGPPTLKAPRPSKDSLVSYAGEDLRVTSGTTLYVLRVDISSGILTDVEHLYPNQDDFEHNPAVQFMKILN